MMCDVGVVRVKQETSSLRRVFVQGLNFPALVCGIFLSTMCECVGGLVWGGVGSTGFPVFSPPSSVAGVCKQINYN